MLGVSTLGPVELCRHRKTRELYALKRMSKGLIVQRGLRRAVTRERNIARGVMSPFVVRLFRAQAAPQSLCFLSEVCLGGELLAAYEANNLWGSMKYVRYHVAGALLGLEAIHKQHAIYRNLKPQNILLTHRGVPKLADMSLAKYVVGRTFTTCGARDYMAPETVAGIGHNRAADMWSLGVLIFELSSSLSPFESAKNAMDTYARVMRGVSALHLPRSCSGRTGELIAALLQHVPADRLAMRPGGFNNVKEHKWFSGFNWAAMEKQTLASPYKPSWRKDPETWKNLETVPDEALRHFDAKSEDLPKAVEFTEGDDDEQEWVFDFSQD